MIRTASDRSSMPAAGYWRRSERLIGHTRSSFGGTASIASSIEMMVPSVAGQLAADALLAHLRILDF